MVQQAAQTSLPNQKIHLLMAEDHRITVDALSAHINQTEDIHFVGSVRDGNHVMERIKAAKRLDILLLDLGLLGKNGFEVLKETTKMFPLLKIVILSGREEREYVAEALKEGAKGYIGKSYGANQILEAVRRVHRGELVILIDPTPIPDPTPPPTESPLVTPISLTPMQKKILCATIRGTLVRVIAADLQIEEVTVEYHRKKLRDRFDCVNTNELVAKTVKMQRELGLDCD